MMANRLAVGIVRAGRRQAKLLMVMVLAVIAAVGTTVALPNTAQAAPHDACSSDPNFCAYTGEEVDIYLSTLNQAWASCTVSYRVDWGDGSPIEARTVAPFTDGEEVVHQYARTGFYTIKVTGTAVSPSDEICSVPQWGFERSVEVIPSSLQITALALKDIDNATLRFLSADDHTYFGGNTRVHGTITVKGEPEDSLRSLVLEVRDEDGTLARARLAGGVKSTLLTTFGSDGKVSVGTSKLLFLLPSAQADLLDSDTNGNVELKVKAKSANGLQAERVFGSVPKLVRYTDTNRYGGRDGAKGGDDWVKPSVRTVAEHFSTNTWGDFSNMNAGLFSPHSTHKTGNDIDGAFGGYAARDKAVAQRIIGQLNDDTYGSRVKKVFVTFNAPGAQPLTCENKKQDTNHSGFWKAIQNVTLDDGRAARDVIRPVNGHCTHFHWVVSD